MAGLADLAKDMLWVHIHRLASLTDVKVTTDGALEADATDWEGLAAIADDALVDGALLLLNSFFCSRVVKLADQVVHQKLDLISDKLLSILIELVV